VASAQFSQKLSLAYIDRAFIILLGVVLTIIEHIIRDMLRSLYEMVSDSGEIEKIGSHPKERNEKKWRVAKKLGPAN
jgi:uncharacterized metal-binding protein